MQFGGATPLALAGRWPRPGVHDPGHVAARPSTWPRTAGASARCSTGWACARPDYGTAQRSEQAREVARRLGYPVLVRPSYVLGGQAMAICYDDSRLAEYLERGLQVGEGRPILIDKFLEDAFEVDVDALCDGEQRGDLRHHAAPGAGRDPLRRLHLRCCPPEADSSEHWRRSARRPSALARALGVRGLMNVQFAIDRRDRVYVLEVNPRASRTMPFLSKACGVPFAKLAAQVMVGATLAELGLTEEPRPERLRGQGAGLPLRPLPGLRPGARPGDALHRRGLRRGPRVRAGLRQGDDGRRPDRCRSTAPSSLGQRPRQGGAAAHRRRPARAGLHAGRHRRHRGAAGAGGPAGERGLQGQRGAPARRRSHPATATSTC